MDRITVVGGGLAGLVAATECAEAGAPTRLIEARQRLGGRGASSTGEFATGLGPHAFYSGGSLWDWLTARGLHRPYRRPTLSGLRFRWRGRLHRVPPGVFTDGLRALRGETPVEQSLRDWVARRGRDEVADALSGAAGLLTFDHDPGRLSARFVVERMRRILLSVPPPARYVTGGWSSVIDRLAAHARAVGVEIATGVKVDRLDDLPPGPVIVAVAPRAARQLISDNSLRVESPRVALLDIGLETRRRKDLYIVIDLDEAAFVDRFTAVDPSLAPVGQELIQSSVGMRPGESLDDAVARIETILDLGFPDWRDRTTWRRRSWVAEATGALDLPGFTYRDRPHVEHPSGFLLAGDWIAAPGHLAEVSCASARQAAAIAVQRTGLVAAGS